MRKRNRQINIRLNEEEFLKLQRNANKAKLSISNYVRVLINGNSPKECPPLEFHKLMNEVQKYICGMNELKEHIYFNDNNESINTVKDESNFEQKLSDNISQFSNLLLEIRKKIQLPDKAVI